MNRKAMASMALIAVLGVAMTCPIAGNAQDMRTLEIRDGVVRIDGEVVAKSRLPDTLEPVDVDLYFSWTGYGEPVIEIDGRYYAVQTDGIREVDAR